MDRQSLAKGGENAHLPETYPAVKFPNKVSPLMAKRKERPANMDLRVHVLQEQAKRPRLGNPAAALRPTGALVGRSLEDSAHRRPPFTETTNHNNRPTNFTDLEALIAGDRGMSSGKNVFARPPPAQAPRSRLTTFNDIATVRPAVPTDNDILDAMTQDILQMKSVLPAGDSRSRDALIRQHSLAKPRLSQQQQQPRQAAKATQLPECARPPVDWSLKRRALFHSQQPFAVARDAIMAPAAAAHEALAAFAAGAQPAAGADTDAAALQRALMTWQHPDTPLPAPGVCALGNAGAAGQAVLGARRGAWQEAFRSLFLALRAGRCAAFYVATAQARCLPGSQCELSATELPGLGALNGFDMSHAGCKRPFVAYFGGAGTGGHARLHAWLSRSTHGARERMRAEPHSLRFTMPLAPQARLPPFAAAAEADVRDARMQAELREIGQRKAPSAAAGVDGRPASLLAFEGRSQVHGLFEWLLAEAARGDGADVPSLLAPVPFLGASIQQLQPRLLASVDVAQQRGAREPAGSWRGGHRLELAGGLLPPWVLDRVCAVLARSQGGQFQVSLETDALTTTFNLTPMPAAEKAKPSHAGACMKGGCTSADEAQKWAAPAGPLELRVMRELSCAQHLYTARLDA